MKQERLNLYRIDMKYIRNLHNIDDRVSSVSPQKENSHLTYFKRFNNCYIVLSLFTNPHTNSIDVTTFKNFILRMYNLKMTMRHIL